MGICILNRKRAGGVPKDVIYSYGKWGKGYSASSFVFGGQSYMSYDEFQPHADFNSNFIRLYGNGTWHPTGTHFQVSMGWSAIPNPLKLHPEYNNVEVRIRIEPDMDYDPSWYFLLCENPFPAADVTATYFGGQDTWMTNPVYYTENFYYDGGHYSRDQIRIVEMETTLYLGQEKTLTLSPLKTSDSFYMAAIPTIGQGTGSQSHIDILEIKMS